MIHTIPSIATRLRWDERALRVKWRGVRCAVRLADARAARLFRWEQHKLCGDVVSLQSLEVNLGRAEVRVEVRGGRLRQEHRWMAGIILGVGGVVVFGEVFGATIIAAQR